MTVKEFAERAGVRIVPCDPEIWGGPFGWTTEDNPNSTYCGAATEYECHIKWMKVTFGDRCLGALLDILKPF